MKNDEIRYLLSSILCILAILCGFFAGFLSYLIGFITAIWVMFA